MEQPQSVERSRSNSQTSTTSKTQKNNVVPQSAGSMSRQPNTNLNLSAISSYPQKTSLQNQDDDEIQEIPYEAGSSRQGVPKTRFTTNSTTEEDREAVNLAFKQRGTKEQDNFEEVIKSNSCNEILKYYNNNWFEAKEHLAYVKYAKNPEEYEQRKNLMKKLLEYREKETNNILKSAIMAVAENKKIQTEIGIKNLELQEIQKGEKTIGYEMVADSRTVISAIAPGSQTLTSDIDITFNVPGNEKYEVNLVKEFNAEFRKNWEGLSSGIVFDVNAYTSGFMSNASGHIPVEENEQKSQKPFKSLLGEKQKQNVKATRHLTQMALGYLPIRKYFAKETKDWDEFKSTTKVMLDKDLKKAEIPPKAISKAEKDVNEIFAKTEKLYQQTETALTEKKNEIKQECQNNNPTELSQQHLDALAGDQLYEDQLDTIYKLLEKRQNLVIEINKLNSKTDLNIFDKIINLKDKIINLKRWQHELVENMNEFEVEQGKALVYANEAYYTAGAAIHVVKGIQGGSNITLGRQQQMASVLMNVGYKLMHYKHNLQEGGQGRALLATAKYGERIRDIVRQGQGSGGREENYKPDVDPKLHELLKGDMEVLDNEKELIDNYKKNNALDSPAAKEAQAQKDFGKMSQNIIEKTYLNIAQSVLSPFYANKYEANQNEANQNEAKNPFWSTHSTSKFNTAQLTRFFIKLKNLDLHQ